MLARKEDAYLYDIPVPAEAAPAVQAEVPREPLLRHQLNTNLRNWLKIEIAQLKSPSRIESIAVQELHMQVPQNIYFSHEGE